MPNLRVMPTEFDIPSCQTLVIDVNSSHATKIRHCLSILCHYLWESYPLTCCHVLNTFLCDKILNILHTSIIQYNIFWMFIWQHLTPMNNWEKQATKKKHLQCFHIPLWITSFNLELISVKKLINFKYLFNMYVPFVCTILFIHRYLPNIIRLSKKNWTLLY